MLTPKCIPFSFTVLLETVSLDVKELMLEALSTNIVANKIPKPTTVQPITNQASPVESKLSDSPMDMSALVEHVPDMKLGKVLSDGIRAELENLHLKGPTSKVHTQWLSPSSDSRRSVLRLARDSQDCGRGGNLRHLHPRRHAPRYAKRALLR